MTFLLFLDQVMEQNKMSTYETFQICHKPPVLWQGMGISHFPDTVLVSSPVSYSNIDPVGLPYKWLVNSMQIPTQTQSNLKFTNLVQNSYHVVKLKVLLIYMYLFPHQEYLSLIDPVAFTIKQQANTNTNIIHSAIHKFSLKVKHIKR